LRRTAGERDELQERALEVKLDIDAKARVLFAAFLALIALAALLWYWLAASHFTTYRIYTRDAVSGLIADAPVEYHGVEIGKVRRVSLVDPRLVRIDVAVEKGTPVSAATVATVTSRGVAARGFTGYVYVALEDAALEDIAGNTTALATPAGEPHPVIRSAPARIVTLDTAVSQVSANVQAMTDQMRSLLDGKTVASLRQSLDNLQQVTKVLADNSTKLATIIARSERASQRIEPLLQSGQQAVNGVQDITRKVGPLLDSAQANLRALEATSGRIQPLLESSQESVNTIRNQVLPQVLKAIADLDNLSASFTDLANRINRDPSVLIRGTAPQPGPGEGR
jgi:phospholipid/cholesterol/gamma-HCH transport system substrate-binding protein